MCVCGSEIESSKHFLLDGNRLFKNHLNNTSSSFLKRIHQEMLYPLDQPDKYEKNINAGILKSTITYLK